MLRPSNVFPLRAALTVVAAVLVSGCGQPPGPPPGPPGGPAKVGVLVLHPQRVTLTTELPGRTTPYMIAEVRPQVGGLIKARNFREGSDVKAGELLYEIDPALYQAAYGNAQAGLAKARASLASVRLKAQRYKELATIKAVSQQEYDDADALLRQGEADVAASQAALETDRINLAHTRVTAPISGRIGRSSVTPGALVTASQESALATVQQLDPIYVDVTQPATAVLRLKRALAEGRLSRGAGDAAKVRLLLEDGSTYPHEGRLAFSEVTVDPDTGSITLRAVFPNPDADLLPGMYVRAVLEEGVNEQALLVPQPAVSRDGRGQPVVMVVDGEDKLQSRPVKTERAIGDQWLVSEGLQAGDRLAIDGVQKSRPGELVRPVPLDASAAPPAVALDLTESSPSALR